MAIIHQGNILPIVICDMIHHDTCNNLSHTELEWTPYEPEVVSNGFGSNAYCLARISRSASFMYLDVYLSSNSLRVCPNPILNRPSSLPSLSAQGRLLCHPNRFNLPLFGNQYLLDRTRDSGRTREMQVMSGKKFIRICYVACKMSTAINLSRIRFSAWAFHEAWKWCYVKSACKPAGEEMRLPYGCKRFPSPLSSRHTVPFSTSSFPVRLFFLLAWEERCFSARLLNLILLTTYSDSKCLGLLSSTR